MKKGDKPWREKKSREFEELTGIATAKVEAIHIERAIKVFLNCILIVELWIGPYSR
jgi:hypothetical protein